MCKFKATYGVIGKKFSASLAVKRVQVYFSRQSNKENYYRLKTSGFVNSFGKFSV